MQSAGKIMDIAALYIESSRTPAGLLHVRGALAHGETVREFSLTGGPSTPQARLLAAARRESEAILLLVWNTAALRLWNTLLAWHGWSSREGPVLRLAALTARLFGTRMAHWDAALLACRLGLPAPDESSPASLARFLLDAWHALLSQVPEDRRGDPAALERWLEEGQPKIDFSRFAFGPEFLTSLPEGPGVYVMRNRAGDMLYVGKAGNLKRRVRSYFTPRSLKDSKTARIHLFLHSIEIITTPSEVEALLLETRLIRDFRPPVNLQSEVHEELAGYGRERNLVLLVPAPDGETAEIYFLKASVFAGQQSARLGRPPSAKLMKALASIYFAPAVRRPKRETWEKEIVSRWLAAHRDELNFIDVDDAGGLEELRRLLAAYLADPDGLRLKTHYR